MPKTKYVCVQWSDCSLHYQSRALQWRAFVIRHIGIKHLGALLWNNASDGCNNTCTLNTKYFEFLLCFPEDTVFWDVVMLFSLVEIYHRFGGTCCFCYVGRRKGHARKNSTIYWGKRGQPGSVGLESVQRELLIVEHGCRRQVACLGLGGIKREVIKERKLVKHM
jgi:hypothetical protein